MAEEETTETTAEETTETTTAEETEEEPYDKDRAMATIHKLREEKKALKADARKARDLETRLKELEDATKSEEQKRAERLAELETKEAERDAREQDLRLRLAVYQQSAEAGIADADIAFALVDRNQVEYDDKGEPSNLNDVLKALVEAKPILKGGVVADARSDVGKTDAAAGQQTTGPKLTAEELEAAQKSGMTPEEFAAYKDVKTYDEYRKAREALEQSRRGNQADTTSNESGRVHIATVN